MTTAKRKAAKAQDQKRRRDGWIAAGLCVSCGRQPAVRVILDAQGQELRRKKLTRCEKCL